MLYRVRYTGYVYTSVDMFKMKIVGALQYLEGVFSTFQVHILFSKSPSKVNSVPHSDQTTVKHRNMYVYENSQFNVTMHGHTIWTNTELGHKKQKKNNPQKHEEQF